ncbi:hypothetical protein GCM10027567_23640 [Spongiibacter taiwanensis]
MSTAENHRSSPSVRPKERTGEGAEFHVLVHSVARLQRTQFDRALSPLGISRAQWWTLKNLARMNNENPGLNQSELAAIIGTTKASLGKLVHKMEAAALLRRHHCPDDQRALRLNLTPSAATLLQQATGIEDALAEINCAGLTEIDLRAGADVLLAADRNMHKKHIGQRSSKTATKISQRVQSFHQHFALNKIGFLTDHVSRMRQIIIDRLLLPIGLSRAQWALLSYLAEQDGMTQSHLAKALNMSRAAAGSLLVKLEENHLVARIPDPQDARSNRVFLAKPGNALLRSVGDTASQAEDFVLTGIRNQELHHAVQVLRQMKVNILRDLGE